MKLEANRKTLYVSDLDGTLLNKNDRLSAYTASTINSLIQSGMRFSYATARSLSSSSIVTEGLTMELPVIVYNGAFIRDAKTGETLSYRAFDKDEKESAAQFLKNTNVFPLVYAFVDGVERVSWLGGRENEGILRYLNLRKGDKRLRAVSSISDLYKGEAFYFTCIGDENALLPVFEHFQKDNRYRCTLQQELYRPEYWCEIMPRNATKANAILRLKEITQCDRIVSFGDAINDIPMFSISDECYAVDNAVNDLKRLATAVIKSNEDDGVAHWLLENFH